MDKDGSVSWEEFESHLKRAATEQVAKTGCVAAAEAEQKLVALLLMRTSQLKQTKRSTFNFK